MSMAIDFALSLAVLTGVMWAQGRLMKVPLATLGRSFGVALAQITLALTAFRLPVVLFGAVGLPSVGQGLSLVLGLVGSAFTVAIGYRVNARRAFLFAAIETAVRYLLTRVILIPAIAGAMAFLAY